MKKPTCCLLPVSARSRLLRPRAPTRSTTRGARRLSRRRSDRPLRRRPPMARRARSGDGGSGGLGAEIGGEFDLDRGDGPDHPGGRRRRHRRRHVGANGAAGGGGGGSFVVTSSNAPLVVAGGGGGGGGYRAHPKSRRWRHHVELRQIRPRGWRRRQRRHGRQRQRRRRPHRQRRDERAAAPSSLSGGGRGRGRGRERRIWRRRGWQPQHLSPVVRPSHHWRRRRWRRLQRGGGGGNLLYGGGGGASYLDSAAINQVLIADENAGDGQVDIARVGATPASEPGSLSLLGSALVLLAAKTAAAARIKLETGCVSILFEVD